MRLIDADELKEFVKEKCSYCTSFIGEESVLSWIDKAPTIEPIENIKSCGVIEEEQNALPSADRPQGEDWDKYSER